VKGLIIKDPWITKILNGEKVWEIRGTKTNHTGHTELIKSGTGLRYGSAHLLMCRELIKGELEYTEAYHRIPKDHKINYKKMYVWVFKEPAWHAEPIPYKHPQGAVIWVNL
jgi:hypothetical protein